MKRRSRNPLRISTIVILAACALIWPAIRSGEMEPPGPPGPTMKPLNEIEPRRPIYAEMLPLTITEPGVYYLVEDIATTGAGITVNASEVTIDLGGFTLGGGTGNAITALGGNLNVTVKNGRIEEWGQHGVALSERSAVIGVHVLGNVINGIQVTNDSRVIDCFAYGNGGHGIQAFVGSLVRGCQANYNQGNGIYVDHSKVIDCVATYNAKNGIRVDSYSSVTGCLVSHSDFMQVNGKAGIWVAGGGNRIDGNHLNFNNNGIDVDGNYNVVVRNIIIDSLTAAIDVDPGTSGNLWETATTLTGAGPWANLLL